MERKAEPYHRQIFVCTCVKEEGKPCCGSRDGEEIFRKLRAIAKERNLHPKIRVAQAKCLGQCTLGANIMVYPDNIWFKGVQLEDLQAIADELIQE